MPVLGPKIAPQGFEDDPYKRTTDPYVTGSSVIALKTDQFVICAADCLASYGRMARFFDFERISKIDDRCFYGASGEMSDFQVLQETIEDMREDDWLKFDGVSREVSEWHTFLTRKCYHLRNKMDPLYNSFVVGGLNKDNSTYLGYTDMWGTHFTDNFVCTGFGQHLALPLFRKEYKPDMTLEEAKALVAKCMRVLYYRDCRTTDTYQVFSVDKDGVKSEKSKVDPDWSVSMYVKGYN